MESRLEAVISRIFLIMSQITSLEQLTSLYPEPHPVVMKKSVYEIEQHTRTFIENSPFVIISTINEEGFTDVSPRGGQPGFVKILDSKHLAFPDSPGNNRLDNLKNIIRNPKIGILFTIPGINEIVRLKGVASVHNDPDLLEQCPDMGKTPKLVVKIEITDMFFHCPKAMTKGKVWSADTFRERTILPSLGQIIKDQLGLDEI